MQVTSEYVTTCLYLIVGVTDTDSANTAQNLSHVRKDLAVLKTEDLLE
jgi:hypothetical protein